MPRPKLTPEERLISTARKLELKRKNMRKYRLADPDKFLKRNATYREANRAELSRKSVLYQQAHPETTRANKRRWANKAYAANPEKYRKATRQYRAANPEKIAALKEKRAEEYLAYVHRRQARIRGASVSDFTLGQWREVKAAFDFRCAYCGDTPKILCMDHLTPVALGGNHTLHNIVPACFVCNGRKAAGPPLKPVQPLLLTIAKSKPYKSRKLNQRAKTSSPLCHRTICPIRRTSVARCQSP
jgi:5-methylcytosine-specific restriction endonuclease McrA